MALRPKSGGRFSRTAKARRIGRDPEVFRILFFHKNFGISANFDNGQFCKIFKFCDFVKFWILGLRISNLPPL